MTRFFLAFVCSIWLLLSGCARKDSNANVHPNVTLSLPKLADFVKERGAPVFFASGYDTKVLRDISQISFYEVNQDWPKLASGVLSPGSILVYSDSEAFKSQVRVHFAMAKLPEYTGSTMSSVPEADGIVLIYGVDADGRVGPAKSERFRVIYFESGTKENLIRRREK